MGSDPLNGYDFFCRSAQLSGDEFTQVGEVRWKYIEKGNTPVFFTPNRDAALQEENLDLIGLEHPLIQRRISSSASLNDTDRAIAASASNIPSGGLLSLWRVNTLRKDGQSAYHIVRIGITPGGERADWLEKLQEGILSFKPASSLSIDEWKLVARKNKQQIFNLLHRELLYSGVIEEGMNFSSKLLMMIGIQG